MNGRIMMGFGVALGVWGAVAAVGYEQVAVGIVLIAAGVALIVIGQRNSKRGQ